MRSFCQHSLQRNGTRKESASLRYLEIARHGVMAIAPAFSVPWEVEGLGNHSVSEACLERSPLYFELEVLCKDRLVAHRKG